MYNGGVLTLTIDTAHELTSVGLVDNKKVIGQRVWPATNRETERLMKEVMALLKSKKKSLKALKRIIVCEGPGSFSAVRCGITTAVTLGYVLKIPLFGVSTEAVWMERAVLCDMPTHVLINAGGVYVVELNGLEHTEPAPLETIIETYKKEWGSVWMGNISASQRKLFDTTAPRTWEWIDQTELPSFSEICANLPAKLLRKAKNGIILPRYWRPPNITPKKS